MSTIFQKIKEEESQAKEELSAAKKSVQELKSAALQKAKDLLSDFKKDADISFENKRSLLEKEIQSKKDAGVGSITSQVKTISSKEDEYIKKGVSFLFPLLVSQS